MNKCTIMLPSVTLGGAYDGRSLQLGGDTASATLESWPARRGERTESGSRYGERTARASAEAEL